MTIDRRAFMALIGATASSALLEACNSRGPRSAAGLLKFAERKNEGVERWIFRNGSRNRVAADAKLSGKAFPRYFVSDTVPMWDSAVRGAWSLEIGGAVRRPITLTLEDLQRLPRVTQRHDHFCVEGWNARADYQGVRLSDIAKVVQPLPDAGYVDFQSFDSDYHESWDIESALHAQTIVVYAMDGRFLSPGYGAPARIHSPVKLGYKNTKYLTRILFLPQRNGGYWSDRGYEWYGGT
jgi:DMSO/TMAO reductase YedYZ molybdopterin-dependent catalytic subunit